MSTAILNRDWDDGGVRLKPKDLRDEFAMRAMTGLMSNEDEIQRFRNMSMSEGFEASTLMATAAYQIADAMLAERAK